MPPCTPLLLLVQGALMATQAVTVATLTVISPRNSSCPVPCCALADSMQREGRDAAAIRGARGRVGRGGRGGRRLKVARVQQVSRKQPAEEVGDEPHQSKFAARVLALNSARLLMASASRRTRRG